MPEKKNSAASTQESAEVSSQNAIQEHVQTWIHAERLIYANHKWLYNEENRKTIKAQMADHGIEIEWMNFITNYLKRAELFGVDTLQGRQALGKAAVTILHCLETAVELFGAMPRPGYPSGEIVE